MLETEVTPAFTRSEKVAPLFLRYPFGFGGGELGCAACVYDHSRCRACVDDNSCTTLNLPVGASVGLAARGDGALIGVLERGRARFLRVSASLALDESVVVDDVTGLLMARGRVFLTRPDGEQTILSELGKDDSLTDLGRLPTPVALFMGGVDDRGRALLGFRDERGNEMWRTVGRRRAVSARFKRPMVVDSHWGRIGIVDWSSLERVQYSAPPSEPGGAPHPEQLPPPPTVQDVLVARETKHGIWLYFVGEPHKSRTPIPVPTSVHVGRNVMHFPLRNAPESDGPFELPDSLDEGQYVDVERRTATASGGRFELVSWGIMGPRRTVFQPPSSDTIPAGQWCTNEAPFISEAPFINDVRALPRVTELAYVPDEEATP